MPRGLSSSVISELESANSTAEYLIEIQYYDPDIDGVDYERITTAPFDIQFDADGDGTDETFSSVGIPSGNTALGISTVQETRDKRAQSIDLTLDAVEQTFVSKLLNRDFRGRPIKIWERFYNDNDGSAIDTFMIWEGLQNEDYTVTHRPPEDNQSVGTAKIETQSVSEVARLDQTREVLCNVDSHNAMLERAGLSVETTDEGFSTVPGIADRKIFWGTDVPDEFKSDKDSPGGGGGDNYVGQPSGEGKSSW